MARLLVVEDDPGNRELLETMLLKLGHRSVAIEDGEQALAELAAGSFEAVLMDVKLPGRDGREITRAMRAAGDETTVVAITAHALAGDRERCLAAGMNAYLAKPITLDLLTAVLAEVGIR